MFDNEMTWNSKLKLFCTLVNHFWGFGNSLSKFFWETCLGCTISLGESIGAICARTKPYLFSYMYALCTVYAKDIFNLCLGTSKTAYMFRMHNFPRRVNRRSLCTKKTLPFLCLGTFAPLTLPSKTAHMFRMHNFPRRVNRRNLCTKKTSHFFPLNQLRPPRKKKMAFGHFFFLVGLRWNK